MHIGPASLVCLATLGLSLQVLSLWRAALVTLAIFSGQCVVGWTNDLIDFDRDQRAGRHAKPLVAGEIRRETLRRLLAVGVVVMVGLSLLSPLHVRGTVLHLLGVASATLYNLRLKQTVLSFVPYLVSFGLLPLAVYATVGRAAPSWLIVAFAGVACAFHFINVLKDLDEDRRQGVLGLPQRIGRRWSLGVAVALLVAVVVDLALTR
jgi:4-hydroxybenzoate polyprenyltransferase